MTGARRRPRTPAPDRALADLRVRLADAEETLRAIHTGEVDAVVVAGAKGRRVFTLDGAEHAYRTLIECMNEGALMLAPDETILYANQCFARMVKWPLEQVIGGSFARFLAVEDGATLRPLLEGVGRPGSKAQALLRLGDGSSMTVQISIWALPRIGSSRATVGMVVTDMTDARRDEALLRALTHRVVQVQETERGRVALELHDRVTQPLCAVHLRSHALVTRLSDRDAPSKKAAIRLRDMIGRAADDAERISRGLRPGVLEQLGLTTVLRSASAEFADRMHVPLAITCVELPTRLPAATELALYRVLQEALRNVEQHAGARNVSISLTQADGFVELAITDDGIGFDADHHMAGREGERGLGLLSMRERTTYVGGSLRILSARGGGTTVVAQVPFRGAPRRGRGTDGVLHADVPGSAHVRAPARAPRKRRARSAPTR